MNAFKLIAAILALSSWVRGAEPISADEARRLAERYIVEQGYTKKPADREKLNSESFMKPAETIDVLLQERFNSLLPQACGVLPIQLEGKRPGWTVGFRHVVQGANDTRVSVVEMEPDGSKPFVSHYWFPIETFRKPLK